VADLESLVEPTAWSRPQSPVLWTSRGNRRLTRELQTLGHNVCSHLAADLLHAAGYSLQLNQQTREGCEFAIFLTLFSRTHTVLGTWRLRREDPSKNLYAILTVEGRP
jgi:hypothetical protein